MWVEGDFVEGVGVGQGVHEVTKIVYLCSFRWQQCIGLNVGLCIAAICVKTNELQITIESERLWE